MPKNRDIPAAYRDANGYPYWWSETHQCYVYQSGHRVYTGGQQLPVQQTPTAQQPFAAQTPRIATAHPTALPSADGAAGTSGASTGSQSPEYRHSNIRGRSTSSAASVGSGAATLPYGSNVQPYQPAATSPIPYGSTPPIGRNWAALQQYGTIGASGAPAPGNHHWIQSSHYQSGQPSYGLSATPQRRDWYQAGASPGAPSNASFPPVQQVQAGPSRRQKFRKEIQPTPGEHERLDPRYKRRQSKWFQLGRVFRVYWPEPAGNEGREDATVVTERREPLPKEYQKELPKSLVRDRQFGEYIYSKIRWFIVVSARENKCLCIPIITYGGQGVTKQRVIKNEHAIVYTSKAAPDPHPDEVPQNSEERPMRTPIRIRPDEPGDKLMEMSRVDYGRVYTVESNVKARAFGWVHDDSQKDCFYTAREVLFGIEPSSDTQSRRRGRENDGMDEEDEEDSDGIDSDEESDDDKIDQDDRDSQKGNTGSSTAKGTLIPTSGGVVKSSKASTKQKQPATHQHLTSMPMSSSQAAQLEAAQQQHRAQQRAHELHTAQVQHALARTKLSQQSATGERRQTHEPEEDSNEEDSDEEDSEDEDSDEA